MGRRTFSRHSLASTTVVWLFLTPDAIEAQAPNGAGAEATAPVAPPAAQSIRAGGFVDVNAYYDTRNFSTVTANILGNLGSSFQYFSFVNYFSSLEATPSQDLTAFYSEQHLRWGPIKSLPLDLTAMAVLRSGEGNDLARLGIRWRPAHTPGLQKIFAALNLSYTANFHVVQFDRIDAGGWRTQIEHVYRLEVFPESLDRRVYVAGFIDHDLWFGHPDEELGSRVVTEHQIGVALRGGLHAIAELRYNHNLAGTGNASGIGFGLQYVLPFYLAN